MAATPRLNMSVVEECLDEAEFLWGARTRALDAHDQDMDRVSEWSEARLLGALDGVVLAGDAAVGLLVPALKDGPPARTSVAAYALAALHTQPAVEALIAALSEGVDVPAIRAGLELAVSDLLLQRLLPAAARSHEVLALLTDLRAAAGAGTGDKIPALWGTAHDGVRAATVRLCRHAPRPLAINVVATALAVEYPEIRIEAIELGLVHGMRDAWQAALELLAHPRPGFDRAAVAVAVLGDSRDHHRLTPLFEHPDWGRDALFAAGFAGTSATADALLAAMKNGILPGVAAESFCAITGLDLQREKMVAPEPSPGDAPIAFEDDDLDADLVPTADDDLPIPDVEAVARWWADRRRHFSPEKRYVGGQSWSLSVLHERLCTGPMRRRHGWAFEMAMHTQGECRVQTRALMSTQKHQLDKLRELLPRLPSRKHHPMRM